MTGWREPNEEAALPQTKKKKKKESSKPAHVRAELLFCDNKLA